MTDDERRRLEIWKLYRWLTTNAGDSRRAARAIEAIAQAEARVKERTEGRRD